METAILLAIAASLCTATSSVCQRLGARKTQTTDGFDFWLILRLARRPIWLAGLASMILGFGFQLIALHYGALALVQPILALELLFVFGYMTFLGNVRVRRRDWFAAAAMSAGLGLFLLAASPSGGREHAPGYLWVPAALATFGAVMTAIALAFGLHRRNKGSQSHRAAVLGIATGISWGFVAAIIKEFSSHLDSGVAGIFSNWSVYALVGAGAASLLLASQALAAGPLAASQPGFTILDPLAATLLGIFLFGERIQTGLLNLTVEALALGLLVGGVTMLSHSHLIVGEDQEHDVTKTAVPSQTRTNFHGASVTASSASAYVRADMQAPEYVVADYPDPEPAGGDQPSRTGH
ncbi:MAG TPA: DMT family transporter [Streptosporangiaceae bacterium]|jgi:drug/metabolite transporter (DMT)-like permease